MTDSTQTHEDERRKERINWSKASLALQIAKVSISEYVSSEWEAYLLTWTTEELEHLPHFFDEEDAYKIEYRKNKWTIVTTCEICKKIFENILRKQHNSWSRNLVWKPGVKQTKYSGCKIIVKKDYPLKCVICSEEQCPFGAEIEGFSLQLTEPSHFGLVALFQGHTPKALNNISEFYWRIGNMFMCFGRETDLIRNTSPTDTDPSLVFKMMKNCKLFEPLGQDLTIYDQVLQARNYLMHLPNQRVPDVDLDIFIKDFTTFLKEFEGNSWICQRGREEIKKLKAVNVPVKDEVKIIKRAFEIQREAVTNDLNVKGRCGVSQGFLTMNEMKSKTENLISDVDSKRKDDAFIVSLKAEKSFLEFRINCVNLENEQLTRRIRDLKYTIEDTDIKIYNADLKRKEDAALIVSLRSEKDYREYQISCLNRENEKLTRRIRALENKLEDIRKEIYDADLKRQEIVSLRGENNYRKIQISCVNQENERLKRRIRDLENTVEDIRKENQHRGGDIARTYLCSSSETIGAVAGLPGMTIREANEAWSYGYQILDQHRGVDAETTYIGTSGGAFIGATIGVIGGPVGMIISGTVGALLGGCFCSKK